MRPKKTWYKKEEYWTPKEPFELGDGSIVEVVGDPDARHAEALKLTRIWPDGIVTTVRFVPGGEFSNAIYLSVEGDRPAVEPKPKNGTLDEQLASGSYRAPFAITSAIPGRKPGETFDSATNQHFSDRQKFNEYYRQHQLEKVSPTDSSFKFNSDEQGTPSNVQNFDVNKGPSLPKGFEQAKFHAVESHAQANQILGR